jgi:hypothetical protein
VVSREDESLQGQNIPDVYAGLDFTNVIVSEVQVSHVRVLEEFGRHPSDVLCERSRRFSPLISTTAIGKTRKPQPVMTTSPLPAASEKTLRNRSRDTHSYYFHWRLGQVVAFHIQLLESSQVPDFFGQKGEGVPLKVHVRQIVALS